MRRDFSVTAATIKRWVASRRWLIAPGHLHALLHTGDLKGVSQSPRADQEGDGCVHELPDCVDSMWFKGITVDASGVAWFPLHGTMYHRDCALSWMMAQAYGGTIVEKVVPLLEAVAARPEVRAVVVDIDSPGGEASGCVEFAATLARINVTKPVISWVSGYMASAAYFVGCAARTIVSTADGWLGSIGSVIHFYDDARMLKELGIDEYTFISKQSPEKWPDPATESGAASYQSDVDACAAKFIETVALYRGVGVDDVLANYGQGRCMIAAEALAAGLCDSILDRAGLSALVASMLPEPAQPTPLAIPENQPVVAAAAPAPLRDAMKRRLSALRAAAR